MKHVSFYLLLLASSLASAQNIPVGHGQYDLGTLASSVACNASSGTRTFTLSTGRPAGFGLMALQLNFTYNAATAVSMTCEGSLDGGTSWAKAQICTVSGSTCTLTQATWSHATSASENWMMRVDFLGAPDVRCTVACTGGGASDTWTIYGRLSSL